MSIESIEQAEKQERVSHQRWCASLTRLLLSDPPQPAPCNCTPPAAQSQDLKSGIETVAAQGGLLPQQEPVAWDDLLGAVARGWGHSKNAHKEMDSDLAIAIAEEVKSLLKEKNA